MKPNDFSEEAIRSELPKALADLPIFFYEEIGSTNTEAKTYAAAHPECEGAVFVADRQTAGRGRMGRNFLSEAGVGLYISFLFKRTDAGCEVLSETAHAAVKTAEAVEYAVPGLHPSIKWVNDLQIEGKKIAGILAEGVISPNGRFSHLVVGVGINVQKRAFPEDLADVAGSLGDFTEKTVSRAKLAAKMIENFYRDGERASERMAEYRKRLSYLGEEILLISGERRETATLLGVTDEGYLIVKDDQGRKKTVSTGEISIRKAEKPQKC